MSCLFDSLSYYLKIESNKIRKEICNYLESNKTIVDGLDTKQILEMEDNNYIKKMRSTTTWGGANEILAACNIWKLKVNVHINNKNKKIEFLPLNGIYVKIVNIIWYGNHYDPLTLL